MLCTDIKKNLFRYSEDRLPPDGRHEFEEHTRSCQACSGIVSEFISFKSLIEREKAREPNAFAGTRILQALESELESQKYHRHYKYLRLLQPALVTFSLILALFIGFVIGRQGGMKIHSNAENKQKVENLKSDFFISEFIDEEHTLLSNE